MNEQELKENQNIIISTSKKLHIQNAKSDEYEKIANSIEYWEERTKEKKGKCSIENCQKNANVGGHIKLCDEIISSNSVFIVPICTAHNNDFEECFYLKPTTKLVFAGKLKEQ